MDTQTIYEIFRACRLCGAGGGYKMPIMPSVVPVDFDCSDIELRHKIRECVQLEVSHDDKMPPLICELCVNKVNDFYEFLDMVRNVNRRTRTRLGLPLAPVSTPHGGSDGDCILGVTEPVYIIDDDDDEPVVTQVSQGPKLGIRAKRKQEQSLATVKPKNLKDQTKGIKKELEKLLKDVGSTVSVGKRDEAASVTPTAKHTRSSRSSRGSTANDAATPSSSDHSWPDPSNITPLSRRASGRRDSSVTKQEGRAVRSSTRSATLHPKCEPSSSWEQEDGDDQPLSIGTRARVKTEPTDKDKKESSKSKSGHKSSKKSSKDTSLESLGTATPKVEPLIISRSLKVVLSPGPISEYKTKSPNHESKTKSSKHSSETKFEIKTKTATPDTKTKSSKSKSQEKNVTLSEMTKSPGKSKILCALCGHKAKSNQGLTSHMRFAHSVGFTRPDEACDACCEWFPSEEAASDHHKWHRSGNRPYRCQRCHGVFKRNLAFVQHIETNKCVPWPEVSDVTCSSCGSAAPTETLLRGHHCKAKRASHGPKKPQRVKTGTEVKEESRPKRSIYPAKSLRRRESVSGVGGRKKESEDRPLISGKRRRDVDDVSLASIVKRKKDDAVWIPPTIRKQLKTMYVRLAPCDPLLSKSRPKGRVNVAHVSPNFGFVKRCKYPYRSHKVKSKANLWTNNMVSIIRNEFYREEDYVHWDSDLSSENEDEFDLGPKRLKRVDSLTALALKTIFSPRCLGKVPRKLRKIKPNQNFDTVFNNAGEFENDIDLDAIVRNLDDEDDDVKANDAKVMDIDANNVDDESRNVKTVSDKLKSLDYDSDTILEPEENRTTNADFDSLFKSNDNDNDEKVVKKASTEINGVDKANDSDATDVSMDGTGDINETNYKSNAPSGNPSDTVEKSNLDGFDIDNIINNDVVLTEASNVSKDSVMMNGDDRSDVNSSKAVRDSDTDGDSIIKEIDGLGVSGTVNTESKVLDSDGSRVNVLLDDFGKSDSLDKISDEEFNFDA